MTDEIADGPSRRKVLRKGLLLGAGAVAVGVAAPVLTGAGTARAAVSGQGSQPSWRWCYHCQGLFYGPWASYSYCPNPDYGQHSGAQSNDYGLDYGFASATFQGSISGTTYGDQADWAWCFKCQALFYAPFQGFSVCPAPGGGNHSDAQSGNYDMFFGQQYNPDIGTLQYQTGWLWCSQCMGTFYGIWQSYSWCPYGGPHNGDTSYYTYDIFF